MTTAPPPATSRPAPPPAPRPIGAKPPAPAAAPLKLVPRQAKAVVPRVVFYAPEKFGKTTFGAFAPGAVLLMARGETGYDTLLSAGLVPSIPAMVMESFPQTLQTLDSLIVDPQGCKVLVLDALGGYERLCHEEVCRRDFEGDWGEKGFAGFQKGYDRAVTDWLMMLQRLDALHAKGIVVVLLGHSRVKAFDDPMGPKYDKYECDVHHKTWAATARWSDCIFFGKFRTLVEATRQQLQKNVAERKGKAVGGTDRMVYTEGRDAFVAGNRYAMPAEIELSEGRDSMWSQVWSHITRTNQENAS